MSGAYYKRVVECTSAAFFRDFDERYIDEGEAGRILYLDDLVPEQMRGDITARGPVGRVRVTVEFWPEEPK